MTFYFSLLSYKPSSLYLNCRQGAPYSIRDKWLAQGPMVDMRVGKEQLSPSPPRSLGGFFPGDLLVTRSLL